MPNRWWTKAVAAIILSQSVSAFTLPQRLQARADCRTEEVVFGDGCDTLIKRCGITWEQFKSYNDDGKVCGNLMPGQRVCCSSGSLPSRKPKQNSDGSCASYVVQPNDSCSMIAAKNDLTVKDIETFNSGSDKTWGWSGCDPTQLKAQTSICLSTGTPPLPAPISNAICGPTKPGTQKPGPGQQLADLNPCPLVRAMI